VFTGGRQRQPNICLLTNDNNDNPIIIRPHSVYWRKTSVNTICGRIIIGLSLLSSVSEHNMWSYYDWVYCCCRPSVSTICGSIMIGVGRQQRQPNHNTTTYYVYWRTTTTINPIIIRPHIVFTDGRHRQPNHNTTTYCAYLGCRCCRASVNIICGRIMIGLLLSSVSKHNMWWYYDWVVVVFRQ
jgi:hypothetical protein